MSDLTTVQSVLAQYKARFRKLWPTGRRLWQAVKIFQDNWDLEAPDFVAMLQASLSKAIQLVSPKYDFPLNLLLDLARADGQAARTMFRHLYDETQDLGARMEAFQVAAEAMRIKYGDGAMCYHLQGFPVVSTYLWLRYPDKYFIYYHDVYALVAKAMGCELPQRHCSGENFCQSLAILEALCKVLRGDQEFRGILNSALSADCYADASLHIATLAFGAYLAEVMRAAEEQTKTYHWLHRDYEPGLTEDAWVGLLNNPQVFYLRSLQIVRRMLSIGEETTWEQMAREYGEDPKFYEEESVALAKRIQAKTQCSLAVSEPQDAVWPLVLYRARVENVNGQETTYWRLRKELAQALGLLDLPLSLLEPAPAVWQIDWENRGYSGAVRTSTQRRGGGYWVVIASKESCCCQLPVGVERSIRVMDEMGRPHRISGNFPNVRVGDPVMCVHSGVGVVALAKVTKACDGEEIRIAKVEQLANPVTIADLDGDPILVHREGRHQRGTLFLLNMKEYEAIMRLVQKRKDEQVHIAAQPADVWGKFTGEDSGMYGDSSLAGDPFRQAFDANARVDEAQYYASGDCEQAAVPGSDRDSEYAGDACECQTSAQAGDAYTKEDFLREVFMDEAGFDGLVQLVKSRKNVILQGVPGVGKSFVARRLAYAMMGQRDAERVRAVQFHRNYTYEEFMVGYRPQSDGSMARYAGAFVRFCQKAALDKQRDYFFIIDEINRGNVSEVLGELITAIEPGRRGVWITLAGPQGRGMTFSVPNNVYIIGTMSATEPGLALKDRVVRRRFAFVDMEPAFETASFRAYRSELGNATFDRLVQVVTELNRAIAADEALGKGCRIGHSYLCVESQEECTATWMRAVVAHDLVPALEELWSEDSAQARLWRDRLEEAVK